jgi:hypothetical protein
MSGMNSSQLRATRAIADDAEQRANGGGAITPVVPVISFGTVTLVAGVSPATPLVHGNANTEIFLTLVNPNASTALGNPKAVWTPGSPGTFTVTSLEPGTPGSTQTGDVSTYNFMAVG